MIIATFFSIKPLTAILGSQYRHDGLISFIAYMTVFFVTKNTKKIPFLIEGISISGLLISLLGVFQFYGLDSFLHDYYPIPFRRVAFGTMGNPNFLGSYLVLVIIASLYLYFKKEKKIGLLIYGIMELSLLATRNRGSWLGAFVGILAYLIMHFYPKYKNSEINKKDKKQILSFILTTIIVFSIYLITSSEQFINEILRMFGDIRNLLLQTEDTDMGGSGRIYIWRKFLELIKMKPIFGHGVENMSFAMKMHFEEDIIRTFERFLNIDKAHNEFLNIAVSTGIPSLILYISFLWTTIKKGFQNINKSPLYVPLLASIIGYLVQAQFNIQVVMVFYIFFAFLGLVSSKEGLG